MPSMVNIGCPTNELGNVSEDSIVFEQPQDRIKTEQKFAFCDIESLF